MSTVHFVGDEPREVSILPSGILRLVEPDQSFSVPDEFDESYACQPHFFEVDGFPWPPEPDKPPKPEEDTPGKPPEESPEEDSPRLTDSTERE